jgi:peptidyl-prolyl cis-trans isomerase C
MKKHLLMLLVCSGIIYAAANDKIASIDGKGIDTDYVNVLLERNYPNTVFEQLNDEQKKVLISQVIEKKLLSNEAKKLGLDKQERFKKSLEVLSDDLLVAQLVAVEREKITVTNDEIKAAYAIIKPTVNPQLHLRQLVFSTQEGSEATIKKLQTSKHEDVLKIFQELSVVSADSASVKSQGDLGWISVEKIVEPFRSALVNVKPREVVKSPIKGQLGWHVVYLDEVKPQREATMEESKAALENAVKNEKLQKIVQEKIDKLKRDSKIVELLK